MTVASEDARCALRYLEPLSVARTPLTDVFSILIETDSVDSKTVAGEAIFQVFGHMCEYHREDIEASLRAFNTVRQVEFLNNHGTVLVQYKPGSETPEQIAGRCIAHAWAGVSGWNCTARVDCGKQRLATIQQEGRP